MYWGHGGGWIGMLVGGLFLLLVVGGVAGLALLAVWSASRRGTGQEPPFGRDRTGEGGALEILKQRYARGEITAEEYQRMRRDLAP